MGLYSPTTGFGGAGACVRKFNEYDLSDRGRQVAGMREEALS